MEDEELELEELEQEGLEDNQDLDNEDIEQDDVSEEGFEQDDADDEEEIDYKALYEEEQEKSKNLQKALNVERKQRKNKSKETDITKSPVYQELINQNINAEVAKTIAKNLQPKNNTEVAELKFEMSLMKAAKKFEDIEEYSEEIRPYVDMGLSVEDAYYVAKGKQGSLNTKAEAERKIEAKMKNQQVKSKIQKVDTSGGVGAKKGNKATAMDIELATAFGMDIKDYLEMKSVESETDYQKIRKK